MTVIRTPDHRLRVYVSADPGELGAERVAVRRAVQRLRLTAVLADTPPGVPVPHDVYYAYVEQSHVFVGVYWQEYGSTPAGAVVSQLEDEYLLAGDRPKLVYVRDPAPSRDPRLTSLLSHVAAATPTAYRSYSSPDELEQMVVDDLALLLTERYEHARLVEAAAPAVLPPEPVVPAASGSAPAPAPESVAAEAGEAAVDETDEAAAVVSLPATPTPLVGRAAEREALGDLLRRSDVRLVTLSGPGGIGKSRLALAAATDVADAFPDGVRWIDVSTVRDATLVLSAFVHALGLPEAADRTPQQTLVAHLRDRRSLLVVDNFERVVAAGRSLAELLGACPSLTLLVTSRSLLRLRGEHDFPVPPLSATEPSTDGVPEAVRLFVDRAVAADPRFELNDDNLGEISRICSRLDGLPLAIELAAARVRLLTPAALLARLDHRLQVLTGGPRDLPERQRALRAALDWDYELLDEPERAVFRRLSACATRWSLAATEAIAVDPEEPALDVLAVVESLIDKSLLRQDAGPGPEVRLTMLETVREYGQEKLEEAGEADRTRRRHAMFFLDLAEDAAASLRTRDQMDALTRLERDHDNLRVAVRWAAENGEVGIELRLCAALSPFWHLHGHLREAATRLEAALSRSAGVRSMSRAEVLLGASVLARARHDFVPSRAWLDEALEIYEELGDRSGRARALRNLGNNAYEQGDVEQVRPYWEASREEYAALHDELGVAQVTNNLALLARGEGDLDEAKALFASCLDVMGRLGDQVGVARALMNLASVARMQGEAAIGLTFSRRSALLWRQLGDPWDLVDALENAAACMGHLGDGEDAARLFGAAAALRDVLGAARPETELEEYDAAVGVARSLVDAEAFETAFGEGRSLPSDAAVDLLVSIEEGTGSSDADTEAWLRRRSPARTA